MSTRSRWLAGGAAYAGITAALAATGALTQTPQPYLAAVVLTLPLGVAAFIGVYAGYALIEAIGGIFTATWVNGNAPSWLLTGSAILNVVLFTGAAIGNVLLARRLVRARRRPRPAAPPAGAG